jgi:hypothetical protein
MSEPSPLVPGAAFGPYRLVRALGAGGFAQVWEAERDDGTGSVALKILSGAADADRAAIDRFVQEGRIAATLSHPRVVYVFTAEQLEGIPTISMELLRGGSLQDRLDRGERFPPEQVVAIALDLLEGLQAAHAMGIVHRDLKPANCLMDDSGRVKLSDFGISRSLTADTRLTVTGQILGTPKYAAPEQIRGEPTDARSDLYSLGATLYALLEGRAPFEGNSWGEVVGRVFTEAPQPPRAGGHADPALQKFVLRLLEKDPAKRPADHDALRAELLELSGRDTVPADPTRRTAAGLVDTLLYYLLLAPLWQASGEKFQALATALTIVIGTAFEWRLGAGPGRLLLRQRVVGVRTRRLTLAQAALRNFVFLGLLNGLDQLDVLFPVGSPARGALAHQVHYWAFLILFVTMRRSNRYQAIHDRLSGTRVVALPRNQRETRHAPSAIPDRTPPPMAAATAALPDAGRPRAYRLARRLWQRGNRTLELAVDEVLRREIWILDSAADDTPRVPPERPARLRYLRGGLRAERHWLAFEKPPGQPLPEQCHGTEGLPWPQAKRVLVPLLAELEAGLAAADLPSSLSLGQVWVDEFGQPRLLEFDPSPSPAQPSDIWAPDEWREFLTAVASAVAGARGGADRNPDSLLPAPASAAIARLLEPDLDPSALPDIRQQLESIGTAPVEVTRATRLAHLLLGQVVTVIFVTFAIVQAVTGRGNLPGLLIFVGLVTVPPTLLAWAFRGGPMVRLFGIQVADERGVPASRWRCTGRAALAWLPAIVPLILAMLACAVGPESSTEFSRSRFAPHPRHLDFESAPGEAAPASASLLEGWVLGGNELRGFSARVDSVMPHGGRGSGLLESVAPGRGAFGALMQGCRADGLRGHTIRISTFVRSESIRDSATFWFRGYGRGASPLRLDGNTVVVPRGSSEWRREELLVDLPQAAETVAFGISLNGSGRVWIDDLQLEPVARDAAPARATKGSGGLNAYWMGRQLRFWLRIGEPMEPASPWRVALLWTAMLLGFVIFAAFAVVALIDPSRSLHDRLARTRLVMR